MTPIQKLDEQRAKAALDAWHAWQRQQLGLDTENQLNFCQIVAKFIRESDDADGLVVVPREATLEMLNAGWEKMFGANAGPTSEVWANMLAASPYAEPSP